MSPSLAYNKGNKMLLFIMHWGVDILAHLQKLVLAHSDLALGVCLLKALAFYLAQMLLFLLVTSDQLICSSKNLVLERNLPAISVLNL